MINKLNIGYRRLVHGVFLAFLCLSAFSAMHLIFSQVFSPSMATVLSVASLVVGLWIVSIGMNNHLVQRRLHQTLDWIMQHSIHAQKMTGVKTLVWLALVPLMLKGIVIWAFFIEAQGDIGVYVSISKQLFAAQTVKDYARYSLEFPHLFWFAVFLYPANFLGGSHGAFAVYLSICSSITNLILFSGLKRLTEEKTAFVTCLLFAYLPAQIFSGLTVTHEYAFSFVFSIVLWVISRMDPERQKIGSWVLLALLLNVLRLMNSMGLVVIIAVYLLLLLSKTDLKVKVAALVILAICFLLTSSFAIRFQENLTVGDEHANGRSFLWNLYVGANYEAEGRYTTEDVERVNDRVAEQFGADYSIAEKVEVISEMAVTRWTEMLQAPWKLLKHFLNKFMNVWTGTHYTIEYVGHLFQNGAHFRWFLTVMLLNNGLYLLLLLSTIVWIVKLKMSFTGVEVFFESIICGMVAVLLLVETMNKYSLTAMVPLLTVISFYAVKGMHINSAVERTDYQGHFMLSNIDEKSLLQVVELTKDNNHGISAPDYVDENVSTKVVKMIPSDTGVVNKMVRRER